jgi:ABC-type polysaccharide/polyol phosphate transport system ATPase subunit
MRRVELRDVSLCYRLAHQRFSSLKDYAIHWMKGSLVYEELWALRGLDLTVDAGEFLGVIGRNGAGKTTLLKVLSGVLKPTGGRLAITGTVTPLLELGTGFDLELTGRENIALNALLLGHTRAEIKRAQDGIIDFSELGHFIDSPIRNYSTGMIARLAFSIATAWTPEILVVDEVLSVGDVSFTRKCETRMREFRRDGVTLILVSHDASTMIDNCTRCVWLDGGRIDVDGRPDEVWRRYSEGLVAAAPVAPALRDASSR